MLFRKIQSCIEKTLITFKFENIFFHLIHSKEFVAQFRVRVGWNCDATVRTWGDFGHPTVCYLAHNHRSEPKFEQIFEGFKGKKIFSN
jgi:hypothetical protein